MIRTLTLLSLTLGLNGCLPPEVDEAPASPASSERAPEIVIAEASCEPHKLGDAWEFDAVVMDLDGAEDVRLVSLDVVDDIGLVEQLRFVRVQGDPELWTATLVSGSTPMDCGVEYDLIFRAFDLTGAETFRQIAHRPDLVD